MQTDRGKGQGRGPRPRGDEMRPVQTDRGKGQERGPRPRGDEVRPVERARRVLQDLRWLGRSLSEEAGLTWSEPFPVETLVLPVTVRLGRASYGEVPSQDAAALVQDLASRLSDAVKGFRSFRPGHVYCFQCDSPECLHSVPSEQDEVFAGYTATGKPAWRSFPNLCREWGDGRVEKLYADRPDVIARIQGPDELKGELLPAFGRGSLSFNVLGQVVAGLVNRDFRTDAAAAGSDRMALTLQVVETRSDIEKRRLRLNLVGTTSDHIAQADEDSRPGNPAGRLRHALRVARDGLNSVGRLQATVERAGREMDVEESVGPILRALRDDLERIFRPDFRRTEHARERHASGERPTRLALSDMRNASDERFFLDTFHDTVVVLGPRSRSHVFTKDGRHVTSMDLDRGEVERKVGKGRWKPLDPAVARKLRETVGPAPEGA